LTKVSKDKGSGTLWSNTIMFWCCYLCSSSFTTQTGILTDAVVDILVVYYHITNTSSLKHPGP